MSHEREHFGKVVKLLEKQRGCWLL